MAESSAAVHEPDSQPGFREIAKYFLGLGTTGFGGPIANIQYMRKDWVSRAWISEAEFQNSFALIKLLPGPVSYQMVLHLAHRYLGRAQSLAIGFLYLLPSMVVVLALYAILSTYKHVPFLDHLVSGMAMGSLFILFWSVWQLVKNLIHNASFWLCFAFSGLLHFFYPLPEPALIAMLFCLWWLFIKIKSQTALPVIFLTPQVSHLLGTTELAQLATLGLKSGMMTFGTGLAIIPILERQLIGEWGWLTPQQFLEAMSVGQITPGPIMIMTAYLGLQIAGFLGGILFMISVFSAASFNVLTWFSYVLKKFHQSPWIQKFNIIVCAVVGASILLSALHMAQSFQWQYVVASMVMGFFWNRWKMLPLGLFLPAWGLIYALSFLIL